MAFMLGENVGPYRLIEQLGQGGMATVYKAYHARLDRYVAIKALHPAFMQDPNFEARFQREARVVAKLEHSNIVPIYDFAEHGGRPYLVLKYVKGETLKARLQRDSISGKEIKNIFEAVSSALAYAHEQGVLHRDIKPSNVLMSEDGRIFLSDFGLARIAQAGESTLSTDRMLGTPQYISPEQAKGVSDLDQGTDIYSFGVMMYELFVGQVPFSADTPFSIIHDHIYSPLPLPREINPSISDEVERVLLKTLAKDRRDRYQDVPAMMKAYQDVFEGVGEASFASDKGLTSSHFREREVETMPPTPAVEAVQATQPVSEPTLEPSFAVEEVVTPPARKRSIPRWIWWLILPAFILLCLGGIVVRKALQSPTPNTEILAENAEREIRELSEVQADIDKNPDDPKLHLELALAYWKEGQFQDAKEEANIAFEFARDEPHLYSEFGDMLAEQGIWIYAAPSYILAERYMVKPPEGISDQIHQAVYFGAFNPMAMEVLLNPELNLESSLQELIKGRDALMDNDFPKAEQFLNSALEQQPDMPEAFLFEADLRRVSGDFEASLQVLRELERRDDLPDWVQEEINQIRQEEISHKAEAGDQRQIAIAQQAIDENPNDFVGYIDLTIAFWEEGRTQDAKNAAYRAFELADGDSRFYMKCGEVFAERQIWLYAAPAYLLASKHSEEPRGDLNNKISEAVYFASFEEEAKEILDDPNLELGILLKALVEARHEMGKENLYRAEEILNSVLERKPDMLEARLLKADLLGKRGEIEAARNILLELERERGLPEWMRNQIQELLRELDE